MTADTRRAACPFSKLTPREREVTGCITAGLPNKLIGAELGISLRTVELHRTRIFRKLGLRNAVELTNFVWHHRPDVPHDLAAQWSRQRRAGSFTSSLMGSTSGCRVR
ncbi:MAG TPA: helix-turn-helix transcriptional regulator [Burkholderiaceae bacterium]|nr:helix-turn-helix transcriptional regulator [Burkholderiaceae bacterium]